MMKDTIVPLVGSAALIALAALAPAADAAQLDGGEVVAQDPCLGAGGAAPVARQLVRMRTNAPTAATSSFLGAGGNPPTGSNHGLRVRSAVKNTLVPLVGSAALIALAALAPAADAAPPNGGEVVAAQDPCLGAGGAAPVARQLVRMRTTAPTAATSSFLGAGGNPPIGSNHGLRVRSAVRAA